MHFLFLPPHEIQEKEKWMEGNIFKTTEEFEKMIAKEELIEYARYVENYYGTPRTYVERAAGSGKRCDSGD